MGLFAQTTRIRTRSAPQRDLERHAARIEATELTTSDGMPDSGTSSRLAVARNPEMWLIVCRIVSWIVLDENMKLVARVVDRRLDAHLERSEMRLLGAALELADALVNQRPSGRPPRRAPRVGGERGFSRAAADHAPCRVEPLNILLASGIRSRSNVDFLGDRRRPRNSTSVNSSSLKSQNGRSNVSVSITTDWSERRRRIHCAGRG